MTEKHSLIDTEPIQDEIARYGLNFTICTFKALSRSLGTL